MTTITLTLRLLTSGQATYYDQGVMEQVLANRGLSCRHCVGAVALLTCDRLQEYIYIRPSSGPTAGTLEGPFLVADCATKQHIPALIRRNWAVDVDRNTARRWAMRGPIQVQLYTEEISPWQPSSSPSSSAHFSTTPSAKP